MIAVELFRWHFRGPSQLVGEGVPLLYGMRAAASVWRASDSQDPEYRVFLLKTDPAKISPDWHGCKTGTAATFAIARLACDDALAELLASFSRASG